MKNNYKQEQEVNFSEMTLVQFANYYNKNIPASFPKATRESLEEFKTSHSTLFDEKGIWTIDKHRRRFMDWLPSYHEAKD